MTEQEIIDGNKLIAVFMEWEEAGTEGMYDFPDNFPSFLTDDYDCIPPESMLFHTSWDWLMPVVEAIESFDWISVRIEGDYVAIMSDESGENIELIPSIDYRKVTWNKINCVWLTCVGFIKYFNSKSNE